MTDAGAALQKALVEAGVALSGGDAADAERPRAKAVTALGSVARPRWDEGNVVCVKLYGGA